MEKIRGSEKENRVRAKLELETQTVSVATESLTWSCPTEDPALTSSIHVVRNPELLLASRTINQH